MSINYTVSFVPLPHNQVSQKIMRQTMAAMAYNGAGKFVLRSGENKRTKPYIGKV